MPALILASTSAYRRQLLERLQLPFSCERPEVDESPLPGELPRILACRLAEAKARAIAAHHPQAWVIGSDQVADLDGCPLGKPGSEQRAQAQLQAMSGRTVQFHTAVSVVRGAQAFHAVDLTEVVFRPLQAGEITRYVAIERPLDCAGSFKCEGLGITLFEAIRNQDPSALIGLPLIATARLLREAGFQLP